MPYCYYGRCCLFFCPYRPTTEIYTLSLHDALPISRRASAKRCTAPRSERRTPGRCTSSAATWTGSGGAKPRTTTGPQLAPADRSLRHLWRQGLPAWPECGANDARGDCGAGGSDDQVAMTAKTRRELGAMSVLAAMTCGAPAVYGQTAAGDSGSRPVILTFSYTG